jgi:tetratricopeptide (TPR) repeat protein
MKFFLYGLVLALGSRAQVGPNPNTDQVIQFYQGLVSKDPSNISKSTLLAGAYIQKTRETNDLDYLNRASKILDAVLANDEEYYEALRLRNIIDLTFHRFAQTADHARAMTVRWPQDVQSWATLGDALLEMGQYDAARDAFGRAVALKPGLVSYNRMGFYYFITGDVERGIALMKSAVESAARYPENKAWCLVELGNMYFKTNRWGQAEQAYTQAIGAFPASHAAYGALGAVRAAQGRLADAIENYKHAQSITPTVQYAGALFDLYEMTGKPEDAKHEADLIDVVARIESAAGFKANRGLALIYANQERNLAESLDLARADFQVRQDAYTSDVLAWALFKNHRLEEAWTASRAAMKLGAPEALLSYHAGMIAAERGDSSTARSYLENALKLNPGFDIKQAIVAHQTLAKLEGTRH